MASTETSQAPSRPGRRTIVKGAAWAVPAIAVAAPAAQAAASPDPGLNGWVVIWRNQTKNRCYVNYDGYYGGAASSGGQRLGLWIWDANSAQITTNPSLTYHLPYTVTWLRVTPPSGTSWSLPNYIGQDSDGFNMYQTIYTGSYTNGTGSDGLPEVVLNVRPNFRGYLSGSCPTNQRQKITRSVGINGETIAFTREVSFPGTWYDSNADQFQEPDTDQAALESQIADLDARIAQLDAQLQAVPDAAEVQAEELAGDSAAVTAQPSESAETVEPSPDTSAIKTERALLANEKATLEGAKVSPAPAPQAASETKTALS